MQKLVMCFSVSDGCTYSCEENLPFEYESKEKAEYDFLAILEDYIEKLKTGYVIGDVKFAGLDLDLSNFKYGDYSKDEYSIDYSPPAIYTLEEWFEQHKPDSQNA